MKQQRIPEGLSAYESARWLEIQDWKEHALKPSKIRLPDAVDKKVTVATDKVKAAWQSVPGNDNVEKWIAEAINGSFHMTIDVVAKTVKEEKIVRKVNKGSAQQVHQLRDFIKLDLRPLDKARPDRKVFRSFLAAGHGAATGFVAGGAAAAGAASGGMGALPVAGTVAGLAVVDAGALVGNMVQASALIGAHYGFDPHKPQEHALLMSMLGAGLAREAGKLAAMMRVRDLALALAAKKTIEELSKKQLFNLLRRIYALLMLNTAKRNLAKGVPVLGIGLGATINYGAVRKVVDAADHLYPERFLTVKYFSASEGDTSIVDLNIAFGDMVEEADEGIMRHLDELPTERKPDDDGDARSDEASGPQ